MKVIDLFMEVTRHELVSLMVVGVEIYQSVKVSISIYSIIMYALVLYLLVFLSIH